MLKGFQSILLSCFFLAQPLKQLMKPVKNCLYSDPNQLERTFVSHQALDSKGNEAKGVIEKARAMFKAG
ncbi:hypothetical protein PtA15_1A240 [Puccinia triticina]|uniref:Uncharacterized protein n=1 Tax=Puccinia triticina TaxID=208348 RepID=A0ABY7C8X3_9BASI|nr:uncharacterized protein PtA15_1A240 [Puccinia triticina]WAQ80902.1 hypothetical protein PtA15_1A240 [Puccinia triticina]